MRPAMPLLLLTVAIAGCEPVEPPTEVAIAPGPPAAVGFAPISYHVAQCASCHGDYGQLHDLASIRDMDTNRLTDITRQMTEGHGNLLIEEHELSTLVAWHRAMARGEAFVTLDAITPGVLAGDISPGRAVSLVDNGRTVAGSVEGHRFRIEHTDPLTPRAVLRVEFGGRTQDHPIPDID